MNMGNHVSFVCKGFSFDSFLIFEFVFRFIFDIFWISDRVNRSTFEIFNNHISQRNFYAKYNKNFHALFWPFFSTQASFTTPLNVKFRLWFCSSPIAHTICFAPMQVWHRLYQNLFQDLPNLNIISTIITNRWQLPRPLSLNQEQILR